MSIAERLISEAATLFDTTEKDIVSRSRFLEHRTARNAVCYAAMERGESSRSVARTLDGRDHCTILSNRKWARAQMRQCPLFAARMNRLLGREL